MLQHNQQIGRLDRRITFQQVIVGSNESNEDEETGWEDIETSPTVYASKEDRSGVEKYAADKLTAFQGVVFVARWRGDITTKMRLLCDELAYNIISISEIGRKMYMQIVTESGYEYVEEES